MKTNSDTSMKTGSQSIARWMLMAMAAVISISGAQTLSYDASGRLVSSNNPGASAPPVIVTPPLSRTMQPGQPFALSVYATGTGNLTYQWKKGTADIIGATSPNLVFADPSAGDAGSYTVVVSDGVNQTASSPAVLSFYQDPLAIRVGGGAMVTQSGSIQWRVITDPSLLAPGGSYSIGVTGAEFDVTSMTVTATVTQMSELFFRLKGWVGNLKAIVTGQDGLPSREHQLPASGGDWADTYLHLPKPGTYTIRFEVISSSTNSYVLLGDLALRPSVDTDNDGMADSFERKYFPNGVSALPGDDYDGDTNPNLTEFLDRTSPITGSEYIRRIFMSIAGDGTVARSVEEPVAGYGLDVPVTFTPVPAPGNVFLGWTYYAYLANDPDLLHSSVTVTTSAYSRRLFARFAPEVGLATAADAAGLTFTTGGDLAFKGQTLFSYDGFDSMMSGVVHPDGRAADGWVQTTITGPKTLEYDMRGLGEHPAAFRLKVNGDIVNERVGSFDWTHRKVHLPPGNHVVRWEVSRTTTTPGSSIRLFIDRVTVSNVIDSDGDGLSDAWEEDYFSGLGRDGTLDYDDDGVIDSLEYTQITVPWNSSSRRHMITVATSGNGTAAINPSRSYYMRGTTIHLSAVASPGWRLDRWEGLPEANAAEYDYYVYKDLALTAIFVPANDLAEALDQTSIPLASTIPSWRKVTAGTHDGVDAAQPPTVTGTYTSSTISSTVTGPKVMSFWWKSQSTDESGGLYFSMNYGDSPRSLPGITGWRREFIQIPAGTHTLNWTFNRGADVASTAWLDQIMVGDDVNQDGLPDDWENLHFPTTVAAAGDDADGDTIPNQDEWADGTNPKSSSSVIYRLSVVKPNDFAVTISPDLVGYAPGAVVTLTAPTGAFTGWSGSVTSATNPLAVTMNSNKTITANFNQVAEGLDNPGYAWTNGGVGQWGRHSDPYTNGYVGNDAARSPENLTADQESWTQTTITGPGYVSFKTHARFNTSSSSLKWTLDGEAAGQAYDYYGTIQSMRIPDGSHVLRFTYKQGGAPGGDNAGFVDQFVFTPDGSYPLAEALDNPSLTWTTATPAKWIGSSFEARDGIDAARTISPGNSGQAHLQTTVTLTQATELSFWWKVSSEPGDNFWFRLNNTPVVEPISGPFMDWAKVRYLLPAGTHTLKWSYEKNATGSMGYDMAWLDEVKLTVRPAITLATALDGSGLTWTTGGTVGWAGVNDLTHDGVDSATSGIFPPNTGTNQESWVQTTVTGPGYLSFWWKVSCEPNFDGFRFLMDGAEQGSVARLTGESGWQKVLFPVPSGSHTLRWNYVKDSFGSEGEDQAWLDEVSFSKPGSFGYWSVDGITDPAKRGQLVSAMNDGIVNLHKYAFNLSPSSAIQGNARHLTPGIGVSGMPVMSKIGSGANQKLRIEFIRRKSPTDLIYTPQFSTNLSTWPLSASSTTVTSIDGTWERVVVESPASATTVFGRIIVTGP